MARVTMDFEQVASAALVQRARDVRELLERSLPGRLRVDLSGASPNGPCAEFGVPVHTALAPELSVCLFEDSSQVILGPCNASIELANDLGASTIGFLANLLTHPLKVRVRRRWFGGLDGCFCVTDATGTESCAGDILAAWFGRTEHYDRWLR